MNETVAMASPVTTTARRVQMVVVGMLMTLLAAISLSAWSQPAPPPPAMGDRPPAMGGPGMDGHGPMGRGPGMGGMHRDGGMGEGMMFRGSPERMGRMIDMMLDGLGATDAQRSQIKQIATTAAADLKAQAASGRALRQRGMMALTAPTVDAAAAEQVRQQLLQQHDQMSRRVMQAMLDVARVLTPEQRVKLGQRISDRQARMEDRMQRMQRDMPPRR